MSDEQTKSNVLLESKLAEAIGKEDMIVQCCECKQYRIDGIWFDPSEEITKGLNNYQGISHTYCNPCKDEFYRKNGL